MTDVNVATAALRSLPSNAVFVPSSLYQSYMETRNNSNSASIHQRTPPVDVTTTTVSQLSWQHQTAAAVNTTTSYNDNKSLATATTTATTTTTTTRTTSGLELDCTANQKYRSSTGGTGRQTCAACGRDIVDRFLLYAMDRYWHTGCLRCSACQVPLADLGSTCFARAGMTLCRNDYIR